MQRNWPNNSTYHNPVLKTEAIDWLQVKPGEKYLDATVGGGGHASEIIKRGGIVLGLDQDSDAISACLALYGSAVQDRQLILVQANFTHLAEVVASQNWTSVSGVIMDLGTSQHQVQTPGRGFSFQDSGPLDMRMGDSAVTAAELVNQLPVKQLTSLLRDFGEIPVAKTQAQKIIAARPLVTTGDLAKVAGKWSQQVFQAIRIAVNDELGSLKAALPQALQVLTPGGRLVVISFHSLEDRIVKWEFLDWQQRELGKILTPKPILGSRQSKLRAFEKYSNEKN